MVEGEAPVTRKRQPAVRWARRMAWLTVPVAVAGEAGHQLLERVGETLAHHLFHIAFGVGAAAVFVAYVLVDIRRHGWPTFSWRLRPPAADEPDRAP